MKLVLIMAMQEEAQPVIEDFKMKAYQAKLNNSWSNKIFRSESFPEFYLITNGHDKMNEEVSKVGTQAAAVSTFIACEVLGAEQIINAGTAGGFAKNGSEVGDVYLCDKAFYHDRRVPINESWNEFAKGAYTLRFHESWLNEFQLKRGVVSTGNSLDYVDEDLKRLHSFGAQVKEMEAASIAELCQEVGVPLTVIKSVTDIVDGKRVTADEFLENLQEASQQLSNALIKIIHNKFYN